MLGHEVLSSMAMRCDRSHNGLTSEKVFSRWRSAWTAETISWSSPTSEDVMLRRTGLHGKAPAGVGEVRRVYTHSR